jgi:hypothetical protein
MKLIDKAFPAGKVDKVEDLFERSFKITCKDCGWYSILRRNGGMTAMFINNWNHCRKCGSDNLMMTKPTPWEKMNPFEQIRKYYEKATEKIAARRRQKNKNN